MPKPTPQPGSGPPPGPLAPPPAKRGRTGRVVSLSVLGTLCLAAAAGLLIALGGDTDRPSTDGESAAPTRPGVSSYQTEDRGPVKDVKITSCAVDPATGWPTAALTVTNSGDRTRSFLVGVEFLAPDGVRLAEGAAVSNDLGPGRRANVTAAALVQVKEAIRCAVLKVTVLPGS